MDKTSGQHVKLIKNDKRLFDNIEQYIQDKPETIQNIQKENIDVYLMNTLPVGTTFYVINGLWAGFVAQDQFGVKMIFTGCDPKSFEEHITPDGTINLKDIPCVTSFHVIEGGRPHEFIAKKFEFGFYENMPTVII